MGSARHTRQARGGGGGEIVIYLESVIFYSMTKHHAWQNSGNLTSRSFSCGYCGQSLASEKGYFADIDGSSSNRAYIYICHHCHQPTYFSEGRAAQIPSPLAGESVTGIDDDTVKNLYTEARKAADGGAPTAAVMACRVILMHIAVAKGAKANKDFEFYVDFLNSKGYVPKGLEEWANSIRKMGNKANHKIIIMTPEQAKNILKFTGTLLKIIYEMPLELKQQTGNNVKPILEIKP